MIIDNYTEDILASQLCH